MTEKPRISGLMGEDIIEQIRSLSMTLRISDLVSQDCSYEDVMDEISPENIFSDEINLIFYTLLDQVFNDRTLVDVDEISDRLDDIARTLQRAEKQSS